MMPKISIFKESISKEEIFNKISSIINLKKSHKEKQPMFNNTSFQYLYNTAQLICCYLVCKNLNENYSFTTTHYFFNAICTPSKISAACRIVWQLWPQQTEQNNHFPENNNHLLRKSFEMRQLPPSVYQWLWNHGKTMASHNTGHEFINFLY